MAHQKGTTMSELVSPSGAVRIDADALAGEITASGFAGWDSALVEEFTANRHNFQIGSALLSETDQVRVWQVRLDPGERLPAHRHVLDYFWTALTAGSGRQHVDDGTTRVVRYHAGETHHFDFAPGEYLLHDLENIGDTQLLFVTVEHKTKPAQLALQSGAPAAVGTEG